LIAALEKKGSKMNSIVITHRQLLRRDFTFCNKHCSEILLETLLSSVSNDLLPFVVGQGHNSLTLLRLKKVMLSQHCQQAIQVLCKGHEQEAF
jgi:hypothetical protein